jgi:hypothetical protein
MAVRTRKPGRTKTPPDDVGVEQSRRGRLARRLGMAVLVGIVVAALTGTLGVKTRTVSARGDGYTMTVTFPSRARPGLPIRWAVHLTHEGGFKGPITIGTTADYFHAFDFNNIDPNVSSEKTQGDLLLMTFDQPAGSTLYAVLDALVESGRQHGTTARTVLFRDGRPLLTVSYSTTILP